MRCCSCRIGWTSGWCPLLTEYKGKHLQSVTKGDLDLGDLADKEEKEQTREGRRGTWRPAQAPQGGPRRPGGAVRASTRLVDSPACIVVGEYDMSANLARVLKSVGQNAPASKPTLEVNLDHLLVKRLEPESDDRRFDDLGLILFDQAQLAEGGQLDDPAAFVGRLNKLMTGLMLSGR